MGNEVRKCSKVWEQIRKSITPEEMQKTRNSMWIAIKINDSIERNNISKSEFARQMGVDVEEVYYWLSGSFDFTDELLDKLNKFDEEIKL